jgi:hypothetical protein
MGSEHSGKLLPQRGNLGDHIDVDATSRFLLTQLTIFFIDYTKKKSRRGGDSDIIQT